jgi:hypothetical protein
MLNRSMIPPAMASCSIAWDSRKVRPRPQAGSCRECDVETTRNYATTTRTCRFQWSQDRELGTRS